MRRNLKIILFFSLLIGLTLISLCALGFRMVTRSLPVIEGNLELSQLGETVNVYRDGYHIPHIIAKNEYDLFFSQGFITAQDRLWQMDLWRRAAKGRLSEIFGAATLGADSLMLTVGIHRIARAIKPNLSRESLNTLQAYTDGINAYMESFRNRLPVEFLLLEYMPGPWEVEDCLAVMRWLQFQTISGWKTEITLAAILERIGSEKARWIFPDVPWKKQFPECFSANQGIALHEKIGYHRSLPFQYHNGFGSNSWVISGKRSVTGKPLLASDPHMGVSNPAIFFENHLVGGDFNVSGFSFPGLPGVIIGHNNYIAWGMTSLMADDMDLFVETLHPADITRYRYGNQYLDLQVIEETIPVRLDSTIRMKVFITRHGPVINKMLSGEKSISCPIALHWSGFDITDDILSYYQLNKATDWTSFKSALSHYKLLPQTFTYADVNGNIGLQAAGMIPLRNGVGFLPRDGSNPDMEWKGSVPFEKLPSQYNPENGILITANQKTLIKDGSAVITETWPLSSRYDRLESLLTEKEQYSVMDFKRIQSDDRSLYHLEMLKILFPAIENAGLTDPIEKQIAARMKEWNGDMKTGYAEAAVMSVWIQHLLWNVFGDELGDNLLKLYLETHSIPLNALKRQFEKFDSPWLEKSSLMKKSESKTEMIIKSFQSAVDELKKKQGADRSKWSWGSMHTLLFEHPLGSHPLLRSAFNLGPFPVAGTAMAVNSQGYRLDKPFQVAWAPAARIIVDLNNLDNVISVIPTGQSGQVLDEHFRDQLQLYTNNLYHPGLMDTTKIIHSGWSHLTLKRGNSHAQDP